MGLADLLANGDDDALPADHGAEAERDRNGDLDPARNELGRAVERAFVAVEGSHVGAGEFSFLVLHQKAKRLGGKVHVVTGVADLVGGHLGQVSVLGNLVGDLFHQDRQGRESPFVDLVLSNVIGYRRPWIAHHAETGGLASITLLAAVELVTNCWIWLSGSARLSA